MTPLWTLLRPIGNSWPARLTILIPLVGYFIVFNDALSHSRLTELVGEFDVRAETLGLSVSPRLFQVYFGLCFVALASALYGLGCPEVIKRHPSAGEYVATEGDHLGEYGVREIEVTLAKADPDFDRFRQRIQNRISSQYSPQEAVAEIKIASLVAWYNAENRRRAPLQLLVACFYALGFLALLIPATKVFLKVSFVLVHLIERHGLSAIW